MRTYNQTVGFSDPVGPPSLAGSPTACDPSDPGVRLLRSATCNSLRDGQMNPKGILFFFFFLMALVFFLPRAAGAHMTALSVKIIEDNPNGS